MPKILTICTIWLCILGVYWKLAAFEGEPAKPDVTASLDILLDGPDLFIDLDVPPRQLIGFDHAPTNAEERATLVEAHRLLDSGLMVIPAAAARCTLTDSYATVGHGYDDLCTSATTLDSTINKTKRDLPATQWTSTGLAALTSARWAWICETPEYLADIHVRLFDSFSHLHALEVTSDGTSTDPFKRTVQAPSQSVISLQ